MQQKRKKNERQKQKSSASLNTASPVCSSYGTGFTFIRQTPLHSPLMCSRLSFLAGKWLNHLWQRRECCTQLFCFAALLVISALCPSSVTRPKARPARSCFYCQTLSFDVVVFKMCSTGFSWALISVKVSAIKAFYLFFILFFFKKITSQQLFVKKIKVENKLKVSKLENEWLMCLQRATLTFKDEVARKKKAGWGWLLASLLVNDGSFRLLRVRKRQRKKKTAKCKNQSLPYYQMNTNRTQIKKRKKK